MDKTASTTSRRRSLQVALFRPIDIASLVYFRVAFGAAALWELTQFLEQGWVAEVWIDPRFHFAYPFFEWVRPWPGNGMIIHFFVLAGLSTLIMLGALYRLSAALFFLGFTYVFLLEQVYYLNHWYLISLLSFLLSFLPPHRKLSVDALLRPRLRSDTAPAWTVWLLRFQIGVPYFYGGLAKINGDWLRGEPMRTWLDGFTSLPLIGRYLGEPWAPLVFSYGGLLLDLCAVPLLLMRRTRTATFVALSLFHIANDSLFNIGVFPWFMIAATTIFFDPDWPSRVIADLWPNPNRRGVLAAVGAVVGALIVIAADPDYRPGIPLIAPLAGATAGALVFWTLAARLAVPIQQAGRATKARSSSEAAPMLHDEPVELPAGRRALVVGLLLLWVVGQATLPLRHYLIPGNVSWTEEGQMFAWHMMLRTKRGEIRYEVIDPRDGTIWEVDPSATLSPRQTLRLAGRPDLIQTYAHHIAREFAAGGHPNVEVRALTYVSLNGRPIQHLVDPDIDLAGEPIRRWHRPWILPLSGELPSHP
jgi:vitamin K-dependent gamma-carboxylase